MITLHWHTEPGLISGLLFLGWIYALVVGPFRQRIAPGTRFPVGCAMAWYTALAIAYLTVGSPLDQVGEDFLFSAHMVQHNLLMYLLPPLVLLGIPRWLADTVLAAKPLRAVARVLVHPVVGFISINAAFTLWHIPALYEAALHSKPVHILEHVTMFLPSLLVWWAFISPSRRLPPLAYPLQMLYVFALMIGQLPVFAFISFAGEVLYPTYAYAPRLTWLPLSPIEDQVLGGVIMKVANMAVSMALFIRAWVLWVRSSRDEDPADPVSLTSSAPAAQSTARP